LLSFLMWEFVESNRNGELEAMAPEFPWRELYLEIMANCRAMEVRYDRLGLLRCGDFRKAVHALVVIAFKNAKLPRRVNLQNTCLFRCHWSRRALLRGRSVSMQAIGTSPTE